MPLKLGMLGMWHSHAHGIVRQVSEHPDEFSLVGFHDSDPQVVAAQRKRWEPLIKDLRVFDKPEELLRQPLDGVVVEGRVYENLALARLALESGRPVMLEKPAGNDLEEHRRLIDLAHKKHLHVQMIYLFRYMSAVQDMLARARRQEFGHIYEFRGRLPKDLASYQQYVDELSRYKGGIYFEMAGHLVDLLVALLGKPRKIVPLLAHHHTVEPKAFVDHGIALFEFESAFGIIEIPAASRSRRIPGGSKSTVPRELPSFRIWEAATWLTRIFNRSRCSAKGPPSGKPWTSRRRRCRSPISANLPPCSLERSLPISAWSTI